MKIATGEIPGAAAGPARRHNVAERRSELRRAGHDLLRRLAGEDSPVDYDADGAPCVGRLRGSLSYRGGVVAAAAVEAPARVGVDLEDPAAIDDPLRLLRLALAPEEAPTFDRLRSGLGLATAAAVVWSLKESLAKALSVPFVPAALPLAELGPSSFGLAPAAAERAAARGLRIDSAGWRMERGLVLSFAVAVPCG